MSGKEEFCAVWFESTQQWVVMLADGSVLPGRFPAIGYAVNAAYEQFNLGESDFECTEDAGAFYRYERDLEA